MNKKIILLQSKQAHATFPLFPFLCQMQKPDYWKIVEGQFGEMLVGQDGDIMLEASTWKFIQKKLNGNKLVQQPHTGSVFVIIAINYKSQK